jgi:hypothetical protein
MTEIRIYMMEKRDIYRLHLLKSFKLPLLYSSYDKLRLALSWAWNIRVSLILRCFNSSSGSLSPTKGYFLPGTCERTVTKIR